ncbi:MAG: hypothetical protein ABIK83_10310 [Candidatus Zixiibacteriota bacterium]
MEARPDNLASAILALVVALAIAVLGIALQQHLAIMQFVVLALLIAVSFFFMLRVTMELRSLSKTLERLDREGRISAQDLEIADENVISWTEFSSAVTKMQNAVSLDKDFKPDVVIGVGRSGAIAGALLAGNLGELRHIGIDRIHTYVERQRKTEIVPSCSSLSDFLKGKNVLLVMSECVTGGTLERARDALVTGASGIGAIRTGAVYRLGSSLFVPDYVGGQYTGKKFIFRTKAWVRSSMFSYSESGSGDRSD